MALVIKDRVKETTTTTGTGTYTLAGAVTGFETFTSNLSNSDTTYYACTDNTNFEVGLGTFTTSGTTLARTSILASSNSNSAVNWSSGTRTIFMTYPADKAVFEDASGNINGTFVGNITGNVTGNTSGTAATVTSAAQTNITSVGTLSSLSTSGDITVGDDLTVEGGVVEVKNTGSQSVVRFYCESSNAHYAEIQAPAHSAFDGNKTLTLPASTDTLVGRATTDTLTNKSLTAPVLTGSASAAGSILFKEDTDNGTNAVTLIGPASTADVTVTLPAAADTLVGKATTDTLTNKSIDSDNNTITNIVNADIKSSAAIADSKLDTISTADKVSLTALNIDGWTDIGEALVDADEIIVDNGGGGTNRRSDMSRVKTYVADVTLTTAAQTNITSVGTLSGLTTSGNIELGHASDTTLSRSASGTVQIEGNTILTTANSDVATTTTSSSDVDHVLINDGGVLKKITVSNLGTATTDDATALAIALG